MSLFDGNNVVSFLPYLQPLTVLSRSVLLKLFKNCSSPNETSKTFSPLIALIPCEILAAQKIVCVNINMYVCMYICIYVVVLWHLREPQTTVIFKIFTPKN